MQCLLVWLKRVSTALWWKHWRAGSFIPTLYGLGRCITAISSALLDSCNYFQTLNPISALTSLHPSSLSIPENAIFTPISNSVRFIPPPPLFSILLFSPFPQQGGLFTLVCCSPPSP